MTNLLDRRAGIGLPLHPSYNLTAGQSEQDQLSGSFIHEASDWRNLSAMMAGGLTYRLGKVAVYSVGATGRSPLLAKFLAPTLGLATEVTTFRGINQILSPHPSPLTPHSSWFTDYLNFATLKLFGKLAQGQNPVLAHFFQDAGMVAGHQLAYGLNLATQPEGSLIQQFVHAEATNIALAAGTSLAHRISGGKLLSLEKALEAQTQSLESGFSKQVHSFASSLQLETVRMASASEELLPPLDEALYRAVNLPLRRTGEVKINQAYTPQNEASWEINEIARLHAEFTEAGGRLLLDPQISPQEIYRSLAEGKPLIELGSRAVFTDTRWGLVDLRPLAQVHAYRYYPGNIRQAELTRDLAIVFNSLRIPTTHARSEWGEKGPHIFRDNAWNNLPVTWQKFLWMTDHVDESAYREETGYDRFSIDHFEGFSLTAWKMARCLYANRDEMKRALGWKRMKVTNVHQEAHLRAELLAGIEAGSLVGETGYDLWAMAYFEGYSQRAGTAARQLLTPEQFKQLKWPYIKVTNVADQEKIRAFLREGLGDGNLKFEAGYDRFAESEWFKGYSQRAWVAAKSLLGPEEFTQLEWPPPKVASVKEQKYFRKILLEGLEDESLVGESGYDDFAESHFVGFSAYAWEVARSVLNTEQFAQLEWPRKKITHVKEQTELRSLLREGLKDGSFFGIRGFDAFAEIYSGNKSKAWEVARTLLSDLEFLLLAWESPEAASTGDVTSTPHEGAGKNHVAERIIVAAEAGSIEPHMLYRFLLVLNDKPKTLGRRFLHLLELQHSDNPYVLALTHWLKKGLNHSGPANHPPVNESPPKAETSPSEKERLLAELIKALTENPHEKAAEIIGKLETEMGTDPSIQLVIEWMKQQLEKIPKPKKPEAAPPPPPPVAPPAPTPVIETREMRSRRINLNPETARLEDITELQQAIETSKEDPDACVADTCVPWISSLVQVAFSDRSSVEVRNRAGEILFDHDSELLNLWRETVKIKVGHNLKGILTQRPQIKEGHARRALRTLTSALETGDIFTAAQAMSEATLLASNLKSKQLHRTLEDILLKHPYLTLRLAVFDAFTRGAKVILWDEYERILVFEDMLSKNPNRKRMGFLMLEEFVRGEEESGTETKSIERVLSFYLDSQEAGLRRIKAENCPEISIDKQDLSKHLFLIFNSASDVFTGDFQAVFLEPLAERIMTRVQGMSFFALREMFFQEGGFTISGSVPYFIIRQESIRFVEEMVRDGKIHPKRNIDFLQKLKEGFDFMMRDLEGSRRLAVGHLRFPEPRSFR